MASEHRFPPGTRAAVVNLHRECESSANLLARITRFLQLADVAVGDDLERAEVLLVNTCMYTDDMKRANEEAIARLLDAHPGQAVIVIGCLAARPDEVAELARQRARTVRLVSPLRLEALDELFYAPVSIRRIFADRLADFSVYQPGITAADRFLLIAQGCQNRCSYCTIRHAKGAVRSRAVAELVQEARQSAREAPELVLLADDCGSYGADLGSDLAALVDELAEALPALGLKLYSVFPQSLLELFPRLRRHFASGRITYVCAPIQSGSERVLGLMRRPVDLAALGEVIADIRRLTPRIRLFSHIIFGFPSETHADFAESLAVARRFDSCLFLPYGENRGTAAAALEPKCSAATIAERRRIIDQQLAAGELRGFVV